MALPVPARVASFSIYRDGGSLSASFYDGDGNYFRLMPPIRVAPDAGDIHVVGYGPAVLERRVPHLYTDKFTGGRHGYETSETVTLGWDEVERLLAPLAGLPTDRPDERDAELLARMGRVATARGAVPA
jgi:hypothetical protein